MEKLKREKVFRDPLHGYIRVFYPVILKLINTSEFQRLRRIRQLSGVSIVYHAAEHSRFSHSLGVYELARRLIIELKAYYEFSERDELLFLCSALLHDLGHGPYSHTFEIISNINHENVTVDCIINKTEVNMILNEVDNKFAFDVANIINKKSEYKLIESLISSQLDVDRLDYLKRDSYFTGTSYGEIDLERLFRITNIYDQKVCYIEEGIHTIEDYLLSRYHMYFQVYFHPTARVYEMMLHNIFKRISYLLKHNYEFKTDISIIANLLEEYTLENYLQLDDYYVNGVILRFQNEDDKVLSTLCDDFVNRKLFKKIILSNESKNEVTQIKKYYSDKGLEEYFTASSIVSQEAYKKEKLNLEEILIIDKNNKIKTLPEVSKIVSGLIETSKKSIEIFIYKEIKNV